MKKSNFSLVKLLFTAAFVIGVFALTGCKTEPDPIPEPSGPVALAENDGLIGTWTSSWGEVYTITKDSFKSEGTYEGNSLVVLKDSETAGTIFVKYTFIPDWSKGQLEEPEDTKGWTESFGMWYPSNADLTGKWYAISYKDLTDSSVKLSGAFKLNGKQAVETLKEAKEEFTIENGYFGSYSECTKE